MNKKVTNLNTGSYLLGDTVHRESEHSLDKLSDHDERYGVSLGKQVSDLRTHLRDWTDISREAATSCAMDNAFEY